jgi:hypothetical protein
MQIYIQRHDLKNEAALVRELKKRFVGKQPKSAVEQQISTVTATHEEEAKPVQDD